MTTNILKSKRRSVKSFVPKRSDSRRKVPAGKIVCYVLLGLYCVWLFLPMYTILATSFTSTEELTGSLSFVWLPKLTVDPYVNVFTGDINAMNTGIPSILLGFINTMWITLIPLICGLVVSGLSAYVFSKRRFKGRNFLFAINIVIMAFPIGAFTIVSYIFYETLGWVGTPLPLIIPGLFGGVGTVFFLRMFFDGIPDSIIEAAEIDGLGFWGIFFKVMVPLAKPAFISQFIFGFVGGYNSYLMPLLYLEGNPNMITLQLVLSSMQNIYPGEGMQNIYCAASVLGMLPLIIIYIFLQKYFIEGIAQGGDKE